MGFFGIDSKKDKEEKLKHEQEQQKQKEAINKIPIYYTHVVDFNYSIVRGDLYCWFTTNDINKAWESNIEFLKTEAYNCNADCLIDVKINISAYTGNDCRPYYAVYSTGIAVKMI